MDFFGEDAINAFVDDITQQMGNMTEDKEVLNEFKAALVEDRDLLNVAIFGNNFNSDKGHGKLDKLTKEETTQILFNCEISGQAFPKDADHIADFIKTCKA